MNGIDDAEWTFEEGAVLLEASEGDSMPGMGNYLSDPIEYEVKRRLFDPDHDTELYYLEWEENGNVKNQLYTETLVRMHYEVMEDPGDE
jgi:hypothetical protein